MFKRSVTFCLMLLLLVGMIVPVLPKAQAAYENTHVNTGNQRYDIIQIAATQLGYGEGAGGYTKYGAYHGNPNADWCGYFVSWCARQANVSTSVLPKQGWAAASKWGLSTFTAYQRIPQSGDLYFRNTAHVGFVYYVDEDAGKFYTLEGNSVGDKVVCRALDLYSYSFGSPNYSGSNNSGHTHSYNETYNETAHPHKEYHKCSCGRTEYTGNTKVVDSCVSCIQENCNHTYSNWASEGNSKHSRTCSKCNKKETGDHSWKDVQLLKEASCKETGSKVQKCNTCSSERTVTIAKTDDHDYGEWSYYNKQYHLRTCSICKRNDTKKHDVNENAWQTDGENHWHECKDCKEKYEEDAHTFPGDCLSACDVCKYLRAEGHSYSVYWSHNETQHWQDCVVCDDATEAQDHVYSAACDEDCDVCGYVREVEHSYGQQMHTDGEGHWYECDVCGKIDGFSNHLPGAQATEESGQFCTACEFEIAPKIPHVHYFTYYCEGNTHWGECRCGEVIPPENHAWDLATGTCSDCHVTNAHQPNSRNWDFVWLIMASAVVTTTVVTTAVMIRNGKKRRAQELGME